MAESLRTKIPLIKADQYYLDQLGLTNPDNVLDALEQEREELERQFMERLRENAHDSLACFVEYMTPDEPPAPHHEWLCENMLEPIERGDLMRSAISMPPGHAKTKYCTRYFAAWYLGRNPNRRYIVGGHSQDFVEKEFGQHTRDIVDDAKFRDVFPEIMISSTTAAAGNWRLAGRRGQYVTKGVGQKLAGYRGHCGHVDDPIGSFEDADSPAVKKKARTWFWGDFRTRLLPGAPMFIVGTRFAMDDVIGMVLDYNKEAKGIPWEIINLPGIIETEEEAALDPLGRDIGEVLWPSYYTINEILEFKNTLPSRQWHALYKGKPRDDEGALVKLSWVKRYEKLPTKDAGMDAAPHERARKITISVDTANKTTERSNKTAIGVWIEDANRWHYLADVVFRKMEITEVMDTLRTLSAHWRADQMLIEDKGMGSQIIQLFRGASPCPVIPVDPGQRSKEFRFDGTTPMWRAGEVWLPERAPWLDEYESEILAFPGSATDDQADMTSQYLDSVRKKVRLGTKKLKGMGASRR